MRPTKTLLLFVLVSAPSCVHKEYVFLPAKDSCLEAAPPVDRDVVSTQDATCPMQFAACLDVDAGLALEHNLKTNRRWMDEAWIRCRVEPDAGTDAGVSDAGH